MLIITREGGEEIFVLFFSKKFWDTFPITHSIRKRKTFFCQLLQLQLSSFNLSSNAVPFVPCRISKLNAGVDNIQNEQSLFLMTFGRICLRDVLLDKIFTACFSNYFQRTRILTVRKEEIPESSRHFLSLFFQKKTDKIILFGQMIMTTTAAAMAKTKGFSGRLEVIVIAAVNRMMR